VGKHASGCGADGAGTTTEREHQAHGDERTKYGQDSWQSLIIHEFHVILTDSSCRFPGTIAADVKSIRNFGQGECGGATAESTARLSATQFETLRVRSL
jgi:hypothetical protein